MSHRYPVRREHIDDYISNIQVSIPTFQGKNDPRAYLDWERKLELVFKCHNYSEQKKANWLLWNLQNNQIVEDCYKEMEVTMICTDIEEDREETMTKFINGLNREIADVLELQHYVKIEEMVYMAMKVERHKRRRTSQQANNPINSKWNNAWKNAPLHIKEPTETLKAR
ncbi:hypothetical protein GQ457_15G019350 [Hibiscus cannabinus]